MRKYILLVYFVLTLFLLLNILNPKKYLLSGLEADRNFTRQEYLGDNLGKVYKNRFGVVFFNKIYPKFIKLESNFFSDLGNIFVFVPLFGILLYAGLKKFNEK